MYLRFNAPMLFRRNVKTIVAWGVHTYYLIRVNKSNNNNNNNNASFIAAVLERIELIKLNIYRT